MTEIAAASEQIIASTSNETMDTPQTLEATQELKEQTVQSEQTIHMVDEVAEQPVTATQELAEDPPSETQESTGLVDAEKPTEPPAPQTKQVDLTRLLDLNSSSNKNPAIKKKKKPVPQTNQQRPLKIVQKAAPLQSDKSRQFIQQAMQGVRRVNEDGLDHINTSTSAKTRLGRALEMNANIPFVHPDLGAFKSVGGLMYYITGQTQDEAFRMLSGHECRIRGQGIELREVEGLRTILAYATWIKIKSDPLLAQAVAECDLPYRSYYYSSDYGTPKNTLHADWYMPVLEEIARTLRLGFQTNDEDLLPDFDFLEYIPTRERKNFSRK